MGLMMKDEKKYKVLTDLQDLEDGPGGMDFKMAGTKDGITVIQLDTKTKGLPLNVVKQTLEQGLKARLEIIKVMEEVIAQSRPELSPYAPRIISFKINPDKIRDVIGPGGKIINKIIEETGVQIDIEPDGLVMITAINEEAGQKAAEWIRNIVREVEVGETFEGKVTRLFDFGAMVEILPGQEGLIHISELAYQRVNKVDDIVKIGDVVKVKVIGIDEKGRTNLSLKAMQSKPFKNIRSRIVEDIPECSICAYRNICGAPCPAELHSFGNMRNKAIFCEFYKGIIRHAFKLIAQGREKYCFRPEGLSNLKYAYTLSAHTFSRR